MTDHKAIAGEVHVDFTAGELAVAITVAGDERKARALLRQWAEAGIRANAKYNLKDLAARAPSSASPDPPR